MAAERFNSNISGPTTALPAFSGVLSGGHVTLASQVVNIEVNVMHGIGTELLCLQCSGNEPIKTRTSELFKSRF